MRQKLLSAGADELSYEIRGIVKKAEQVQALGYEVFWENIGDPIQKNAKLPLWMKTIISELALKDETYSYSHSKGLLDTRKYLANKNNARGGAQIEPQDITFFNGLGDAIQKIYQYLLPTSRVIGPSPAYSTHSSAEAAHANDHPITYELDPKNGWLPNMEDVYLKIKYHPNIVGIMVINPDNPTGMVYPREVLEQFVAFAKEFNLFLIFDEIYMNVIYNNAKTCTLAEVIGEVPGISLKGISKEFPWPGSRCGWAEFYNKTNDPDFEKLCNTIDNAKMIEVSSTRLPQRAIPLIMEHPSYRSFLEATNFKIGQRSKRIAEILGGNPYITFNATFGAFYNTIVFNKGVLKAGQKMKVSDQKLEELLASWLHDGMAPDQRFVYYLLASRRVCVVPISSFASHLRGFRVTLLEEDEARLEMIFEEINEAIIEYCES